MGLQAPCQFHLRRNTAPKLQPNGKELPDRAQFCRRSEYPGAPAVLAVTMIDGKEQ
ncbi:MAG: hypothetical protein WA908_08690 [Pontixanthobacter sp.]